MTGLPTLTLKQPYASLVMAGVKTIETRTWPAPKGLVGQRIGIHAGKSWDKDWGGLLDSFNDAENGRRETLDELGAKFRFDNDDGRYARVVRSSLPAGVLLGTAVLAECVPMGRCFDNDSVPHLCFSGDDLLLHSRMDEPWPDGETEHDATDQAPFGFFEPGNSAWLLEDPKPSTMLCPWCQGHLGDPGRYDEAWFYNGIPEPGSIPPCPVCPGDDGYPVGKCDPIPAKGQRKVWRWTHER